MTSAYHKNPQEKLRLMQNEYENRESGLTYTYMTFFLPFSLPGHDFDAHAGYLVEALKLSTSAIALHLANITSIADCPVFNPYKPHPGRKEGPRRYMGRMLSLS